MGALRGQGNPHALDLPPFSRGIFRNVAGSRRGAGGTRPYRGSAGWPDRVTSHWRISVPRRVAVAWAWRRWPIRPVMRACRVTVSPGRAVPRIFAARIAEIFPPAELSGLHANGRLGILVLDQLLDFVRLHNSLRGRRRQPVERRAHCVAKLLRESVPMRGRTGSSGVGSLAFIRPLCCRNCRG